MRKVSLALSVALFVLAVALGGSAPFSSAGPAEANSQSPITDYEHWLYNEKVGEVSRALRSSDLEACGVPLAGWYFNAPIPTIYVGLTEIADEYTEPIRAIVDQVEGVNVEFFEARFTEAELWDMRRRVDVLLRPRSLTEFMHGGLLIFTAVDIRNNGLLIALREIRPEYIAAIRDLVGDQVPIEFAETELELLRTGKHRPLLGGIKLTTSEGASTLSFRAEADGESGFVMTGHMGWEGDRVWQPTAWLWNRVGQISVNPPEPRYSDAAFVPNDNVDAVVWPDRDIVKWRASYDTQLDQIVMKEGITTGFTTGVIALRNVTLSGLYNQVVATFDADFGDSGAPVFQLDAQGNAVIVGTLVGGWPELGLAFYSPVEGITFDLGLDGFPLQGATGVVCEAYSGFPILGASVEVDGTYHLVYSGPGGSYTVLLGPGTHTVTASYPDWFYSKTYTVQVGYDEFTTVNFGLDPLYPGFPYPQGIDDPVEVTAAAG